MPKRVLNIQDFSGGLNNNTNSRDIDNNELVELNQLNNEIPGKIVSWGKVAALSGGHAVFDSTGEVAVPSIIYGNGLHYFNLDRDVDSASNASANREYYAAHIPTASDVYIYNASETDWEASPHIIDSGSTTGVDMQLIDGHLRVMGAYGTVSAAQGNGGKKYGYVKYDRDMGDVTNTDLDQAHDAMLVQDIHVAPIQGGSVGGYTNTGKLYDKGDYSKPDYNSELFMPDNSVIAEITSTIRYNKTFVQLENDYLDNYNNSSDYSAAGKGSMAIISYFSNNTASADEDKSEIVCYQDTKNKNYGLFGSLMYDNQESVDIYLGDIAQPVLNQNSTRSLYFGMVGRMPSEASITGFRIYYALIDNFNGISPINEGNVGQKYLLAEVDYEKGIRFAGKETWEPFGIVSSGTNPSYEYPTGTGVGYNNVSYFVGKEITELSITEPHLDVKRSVIGRANTGWKCSAMANRRLYVGNVQYYTGKNNADLITKNDRILKSNVNQFDTFEEDSFIDVEIDDGEDIVQLMALGNKLLQFKENTLYVINIARDIEFLENTYKYKGVKKPFHVVEGEGFICWLNRFGVFLYDGQRVTDIILGDKGQPRISDWSSSYSDDMILGYLPKSKELFIGNKSRSLFKFDIKSGSWSRSTATVSDRYLSLDTTNYVTSKSGELVWLEHDPSPDSLTFKTWNPSAQAQTVDDSTVLFQTKEYTFESPDIKKTIKTIYINYKEGANIEVRGVVNNTALSLLASGEHTLSSGAFSTEKIQITNTNLKNVNSFGLQLVGTGNAMHADFTLNDIQIVYRDKSRK